MHLWKWLDNSARNKELFVQKALSQENRFIVQTWHIIKGISIKIDSNMTIIKAVTCITLFVTCLTIGLNGNKVYTTQIALLKIALIHFNNEVTLFKHIFDKQFSSFSWWLGFGEVWGQGIP